MTDERVQDEVDREDDYDPFEDTDALTQKQANQYIQEGGIRCPYCGDAYIQITNHDLQAGMVFYDVTCESCHHDWSESYKLVAIRDESGMEFVYHEEVIPFAQDQDD